MPFRAPGGGLGRIDFGHPMPSHGAVWSWAQGVGILANLMAGACLLRGERARLPLQNVVALGVLSAGLGLGLEWVTLGWAPPVPASPAWLAWASGWPVSWLGARAMARCVPGPGLARRTLLAGVLLMPGWDRVGIAWQEGGVMHGLGMGSARVAWTVACLGLLAPWWIRKQLSPASPMSPWIPWCAPLALVARATAWVHGGAWGWGQACVVFLLMAWWTVLGRNATRPPGTSPAR